MTEGLVAAAAPERGQPLSPLDELRLYEALRLGNLRAYRELLAHHHAAMGRVAGWYVDAEGDAQQLIRATWQTALGGLDMFTWHCSFRAWLFGQLVDHGRTVASRRPASAAPPRARILAAPSGQRAPRDLGDLPWTPWWGAESWTALAAEVEALDAADREALRLVDAEGWSARDACDALGHTAAILARRLGDAREAVAAALERDLGAGGYGREGIGRRLAVAPQPEPLETDPTLVSGFRRWRAGRGLTMWRRLTARRRVVANSQVIRVFSA